MIERQVGQLVRLVDDLLDVHASPGQARAQGRSVELSEVLAGAVETARPR